MATDPVDLPAAIHDAIVHEAANAELLGGTYTIEFDRLERIARLALSYGQQETQKALREKMDEFSVGTSTQGQQPSGADRVRHHPQAAERGR